MEKTKDTLLTSNVTVNDLRTAEKGDDPGIDCMLIHLPLEITITARCTGLTNTFSLLPNA